MLCPVARGPDGLGVVVGAIVFKERPGRAAASRQFPTEKALIGATACPLAPSGTLACSGDACRSFERRIVTAPDSSICRLVCACVHAGEPAALGLVVPPAGELLPQEIERRQLAQAAEDAARERERIDFESRIDLPGVLRRHGGERACSGCGSLCEPQILRVFGARELCPDCREGN